MADDPQRRAAELLPKVETLRAQLRAQVLGQDALIDDLLVGLLAGGHVLLEGLPGLGKTLLVRSLARGLGLDFARIQFTPDLMPSDVTGTQVVDEQGGARRFRFQPGPVFAGLVLADEINRATPKTQSALLEAMQEGSVTVAGVTAERRDWTFPVGSVRVPTDQPLGDIVVLLLEPQSSESFFAWGMFPEVLSRVEYIEGYAIAPLAEAMMAADPALKAAFEAKLAAEPAFAADGDARLQWFYERTPFHDDRFRLYPVGREN